VSDDPRSSSKYRMLVLHYERQAEALNWSAARFRRLASALQLTAYELGAFMRLRITETEKYLTKNAFPPTVELHLTLIEQSVFPTSKPPIFPDLPCSSTSTS
jgi:hypothetical protein